MRHWFSHWFFGAGMFGLFTAPIPAHAATPMPPVFAQLVAKVMPSVVAVASTEPVSNDNSESNGPDNGDNDDNNAGPDQGNATGGLEPTGADDVSGTVLPPPKAEEALGSGFVIDPAGYILTNNHVIDGATSVTVTFQDGTILPAIVTGRDKDGDLAVLKVAAGHPLPALAFGDSSKLQVGDWVLAIGNPYGLPGSASAGIVSALHRNIGEDAYDDFIQTDATINRGNSGGPLFDLSGHVVGVNSAIYSPSGGSVGIGFAIPSAMAQPVSESLKTTGDVKRGWLGVSAQDVTPEIQQLLGLPTATGALIGGVMDNGPAVKALRPGDVLVALNGVPVTDPRSLMIRTAEILSGQTAHAQLWRNGSLQTAAFVIAAAPPDAAMQTVQQAALPSIKLGSIGMAIAGVPPAEVLSVTAGGPAAKAGVVVNDVIEAVGPQTTNGPDDLKSALQQLTDTHQPVALLLVSGDDIAGNDPGPRWIAVKIR